jgi:hypothetical protein
VKWDSVVTLVKDAEDHTALAEKEAQKRVLRVEVESATVLASAREEAEGLVWKITFLEGELVDVHQAREVVKENSRGLSDVAANAEQC